MRTWERGPLCFLGGEEVPEPVLSPALAWLGLSFPVLACRRAHRGASFFWRRGPLAGSGAIEDDSTASRTGQPGLAGAPWGETWGPRLLSTCLCYALSTPQARGWGQGHVGHVAFTPWRLPMLPAIGRKGPRPATCGGCVGLRGAPSSCCGLPSFVGFIVHVLNVAVAASAGGP